jgi:hypothetical protein
MSSGKFIAAKAHAVADEAHRTSCTLHVFQPSPKSFVHVVRGHVPFEADLPVSAQPVGYIVYWMGVLGEPPPKRDEWTVTSEVFEEQDQKFCMVMWVIHKREDCLQVLREQWGVKPELPEEEKPS